MSDGRYQGFAYPEGLVVLDTTTGEVTFVSVEEAKRAHGAMPVPATSLVVAPPPVSVPASVRESGGLDKTVVETYPYPVAVIYARLLEERDPRQKCRLLVDTFATLLKLWAIALASDYLAQPDLQDANLNELLARDFQRPLISTWHVFTVRALSVFKTEGRTPFLAELAAAYDTLEMKCRTPFLYRTRFEDARGGARTRESKLGKIQALIKYRNGLAHGYNLPVAKAEQDFATYHPVLAEILTEARFMTRYPLHADGVPLMGAHPTGTRASSDGAVYFLDPERKKLTLEAIAALEVPEDSANALGGLERDLFFFEGNTRTAMLYASALGEQLEKQHPVERWRALLEAKAIDVRVQRTGSLELAGLRGAGERITKATLAALVACGKYLPEIGFRPSGVAERITQLEIGDHRGAVFVGDNGSGKSTLVASIAAERLAAGDVVLFYRASALLASDLQARIVRDLGVRDLFFEDFLVAADPLFADGKVRLRVIVDGVNEHPGEIAALVAAINAMVKQASDHPWFRLIATIATAAAERLPHDNRFGAVDGARFLTTGPERSPLIPMPALSDAEVGVLYERYRSWTPEGSVEDPRTFRPLTSFEELVAGGRSTLAMMRSPLMLRLLASAFDGRALDPELSYDEAMRLYFEQIVVGVNGKGGPRWDRAAFLKGLVVELDAVSSDTIARDALYDVPTLKRSVQNAQKDSVYVQLLDLGILTEQWDRDRCLVRFGFARLFEYLLAELHAPRTRDAYGVLELARRASSFAPLGEAVAAALAAQCRKNESAVLIQTLAMVDAMDASAMERGALQLVARAVIERLAREAVTLDAVLAALAMQPTALGVRVLLDAFDALFAEGEIASAMAVATTAGTTAAMLHDPRGVAQARYGRARIHHERGELDEALAMFGEVRTLAKGRGDTLLAERAALKEGEILRARGKVEEARLLFDEAAAALLEAGALADAAEACRQRAITAEAQRRREDARALAKEAIALAERSGNPSVETQCFLSSGVFAWKAGDLEAAMRMYERALPLAEAEGHARNIAVVLANLGILAHERGEWASAVEYTARQYAMAERIENRSLIATSLHNLGVFCFEAGDVERSERSLERAKTEFTALGEHVNVATSLVNHAALAIHRGAPREAASMLAQAIELGSENLDARLDALWLRTGMALDAGELDAARTWRDLFAKERPAEAPRRVAQLAALDLRLDDQGKERLTRWSEIRAVFDDAKPLPEVHELPVDAALAVGDPSAAAAAIGWLRGRPHRHTAALSAQSRVPSSA